MKEVTTITIQTNEKGDTIGRSVVTDRTLVKERNRQQDVRSKREEVVHDTVYIEKRDSSVVMEQTVSSKPLSGKQSITSTLKWTFAILCAIIVLIITVKVCLRRSL